MEKPLTVKQARYGVAICLKNLKNARDQRESFLRDVAEGLWDTRADEVDRRAVWHREQVTQSEADLAEAQDDLATALSRQERHEVKERLGIE